MITKKIDANLWRDERKNKIARRNEFVTTKTNQTQPATRNRSYKAIHYERQTQLRFRHIFNLQPFYEQLHCWCSKVVYTDNPIITLQFDFTLPERRRIKRNSMVFDLTLTKEHEAAHMGLMYARSLFDIFVDELYRYSGYIFDKGLQVGPSWSEKEKVKTCAVLSLPAFRGNHEGFTVTDVLIFATQAIFSSEDLNHMEAIAVKVFCNNELIGMMDITPERESESISCEKYYNCEQVQTILYRSIENRNVLYAFKTENGIRQGMMVKTDTAWKPVEIHNRQDIFETVTKYGVMEFVPAVNRINEEYPSIITIETDPGDMFVAVLGKKKSWQVNTYITEKILKVLDEYHIQYTVKFSGNKGWHILIPVELKEPFRAYQETVEAIVNKELGNLPDEEQVPAMMANLMQLEDVRSYKDPFFVARRFVDLVGARVMFYELKDIHKALTLDDLKRLCLRVSPVYREDFLKKGLDIFEAERGPVKVEIPQVLSVNPYSRFRRQFKLLIDHSSNKREGKLRSILSLHSGSNLVSIPALLYEDVTTKIDRRMWDYDYLCQLASPENVYNLIEGNSHFEYPLKELANKRVTNEDIKAFEQFLKDHRGLLIYLLQHGGEALELLDTSTALWVNAHLWKRTIKG
ncbi:MAG: hypothetical protein HXS44_03950 [Theionarchaea archaeon]|nr:hypothetical protein [Theionarchaea archaeon]